MSDLATTDLASTPFSWTTLTRIAGTEMVPKGLRGKPDAMLACIYLGRELGLGPLQSMQMIDVIDGRPSLSSELQTAMIRKAGHSVTIVEFTDKVVTIKGRRVDNGDEMTVSFTTEMAQRANLLHKFNWQNYPEAMLWARALSMLGKMLFADVFAATHVYTPDELGSDTDVPDESVIAATVVDDEDDKSTSASLPTSGSPQEVGGGDVPPVPSPTPATTVEEEFEVDENKYIPDDPAVTGTDPWPPLLALLEDTPDEGTMAATQTRVRLLFRLMENAGLWPEADGALHASLAQNHSVEHLTDLRKSELSIFAKSAWLAATVKAGEAE